MSKSRKVKEFTLILGGNFDIICSTRMSNKDKIMPDIVKTASTKASTMKFVNFSTILYFCIFDGIIRSLILA